MGSEEIRRHEEWVVERSESGVWKLGTGVEDSLREGFDAGALAVGCWLLAVGCWLLAVGCWLLAVGCWLLEMLVGHGKLL